MKIQNHSGSLKGIDFYWDTILLSGKHAQRKVYWNDKGVSSREGGCILFANKYTLTVDTICQNNKKEKLSI